MGITSPTPRQIQELLDATQTVGVEADPAHSTVTDLPALKELVASAKILRTTDFERQAAHVERSTRWFESVTSYYEKLAFTDGLIIATSLTLLGFLLQHSSAHLPRRSFELLVCPAWVLLIFSVYASSHQISRLHEIDGRMIALLASQHHLLVFTELSEILRDLTNLIKPKDSISPDVRPTIKLIQDKLSSLLPSDAIQKEHETILALGKRKGGQ